MVNPNAVSGLRHLQHALGAVSHNLANAQTTAYRFQDVFSNEVRNDRQGNFAGMGVSSDTTRYASKQGALKSSVSASDLAINGDGYFMMEYHTIIEDNPTTETRYTRNGSFHMNEDGYFVDKGGLRLMYAPDVKADDPVGAFTAKPLQIKPEDYKYIESIKVNKRGEITIDYNSSGREKYGKSSQHMGTIPLARFPREENATRHADGYLMPNDKSGKPITTLPKSEIATILQGNLEQSTSDTTEQLTRMMVIQHGYQANSKALDTQDKMLQAMIGNIS